VDTNVIIAGLTSPEGSNRTVLRLCVQNRVQPLLGMALFQEIEDVAFRPSTLERCPVSQQEIRTLSNAFYAQVLWVKIHFLWRPNLLDESDNHLIELGVAGNANAVVTNNIRDLSSGQLSFPNLDILTPSQFLEKHT
jgi:putative PIN family toxin of toxin-antitoxin system